MSGHPEDQPEEVTPPARRRSLPRRILNRMEVDQAVFFSVSIRVWQILAGPVTWTLIIHYFSIEVQDFFYAFTSLISLQAIVEMGMSIVVMNIVSHEWAKLKIDSDGVLRGDESALSRVVSLGRLLFKWYFVVGLLFAIGVGSVGYYLLAQRGSEEVHWVLPWFILVFLTSFSLWVLPFTAILEGCEQIATINKFRVVQAVTGNLAVWLMIYLGGGIWAAVTVGAVKLFWDLYPVLVHYRHFFKPFWKNPTGPIIHWLSEIWPLQWRIGLQSILQAVSSSSFVLVLFHYQAEGVSGRMGMTWSALMALNWGAISWLVARVPMFGKYVATNQFEKLDKVFLRLFLISGALRMLVGYTFVAVIYFLNVQGYETITSRVIAPLPLLLFVTAVILDHIPGSLNIYARAHKKEPYLIHNMIFHSLVILLVWFLGKSEYGVMGEATAYLGIMVFFTVPAWILVWKTKRHEWRKDFLIPENQSES